MKKFLVLYLAPTTIMDEWAKVDPAERTRQEAEMKEGWMKWMSDNQGAVVDAPAGAGKTKKVTAEGTEEIRNEVMMYGTVNAESPEAAAAMFEGHPHLKVPGSSIEIMGVSPLGL